MGSVVTILRCKLQTSSSSQVRDCGCGLDAPVAKQVSEYQKYISEEGHLKRIEMGMGLVGQFVCGSVAHFCFTS